MKIKTLACLSLLSSSAVFAETAEICESCGTESEAKSFAKTKANPLECSPVFDPNMTCKSRNKIVTFVDANSGQAYKYNVYHEADYPWNVQADKMTMSPNREESYRILMKFVRDSSRAINQSSTGANQLIGPMNFNSIAGHSSLSSSGSCPSGTALNALTNPNTLDYIKTKASIEIGTRLISDNNDLNLNPVKINNSYSLSFMGLNSTIEADGSTRNPSFVVTFDQSEREGSRKDFLAYSINILGYDEQNLPIVNFKLSNASQVAGYTLGGLKGNNGPLELTNSCVKQKFEEAVNAGVLNPTTSNIGGTGGGGGMPYDPPSGGWSFPTSGGCKMVEFSQSGRTLYTFRICS